MALTARIAALVFVVWATTLRAVVADSPPRPLPSAQGPELSVNAVDEADPAVEAPELPRVPQPPQLGDEILQDTLPPHESVVEESPPVYTNGREFAPNTAADGPHSLYPQPHPQPNVAPRWRQHPLRTYLENRPRQRPLQNDSWLNRPYGVSYFVGGMFLDDPLPNIVGGDTGITYGGRLSWDFAPRFGVESRLAGGSIGVKDLVGGTDLGPANIFYWDVNWLWYWTGDTRWRPYGLAGGGLLNIDYTSGAPLRYHTNVFQLPFGIGIKYRHSTRMAFRLELLDNYVFSSGVQGDMHNVSLTAGMEYRFGGGGQRNYWPWNPARNWW